MEALSVVLDLEKIRDMFNGIQLPNNGPNMSHRFYAEDALVIGEFSKGYYLSIYKAPTKVIASLERLRRDFCWGSNYESHKIWWLAWNKMMAPKKVGGPWRNIIRNKTELEVMGIDIFRWVQRSFEYSVKLVRENIESRMLPMESHVFHDSKWVPSKVNIFVWKAVTD
ncbi:hypothetical protein QVD17_41696 [Tagetes erecta]|uniref:Reverse transcriptase zinc-binding domain-containing protein n=1 Tax=Tagetes erecta TaxID=13708 RepID=A0AAD8NDW1_TARER|nr:hypothetical protein QVD17_41696 [Tagetes erecta]